MQFNVQGIAGIIELTPHAHETPVRVDDSCMQGLLESFSRHETLADSLDHEPAENQSRRRWNCDPKGNIYDGRIEVAADLPRLLAQLEQSYAQLCR